MTNQAINANEPSKKSQLSSNTTLFIRKQWAMIKYAFSLERALIHLVTAALLFGFAYFIKDSHAVAGDNRIYEVLLLIGAGIQIFRSCMHSMTPVVILLLIGFGGQALLMDHTPVFLSKTYLEYITGAGVVGLVVCSFYRLR